MTPIGRSLLALVLSILACVLALGQADENPEKEWEIHLAKLPSGTILGEYSVPLIATRGDVAFVSSVMDGALVSFDLDSGRIVSSKSFGEIAGVASMVEIGGRRLIALPTANDPDHGQAASVSVINATRPGQLERVAQISLPLDAHTTPQTRALLTADGRFGIVASSFREPALFSFSVESGLVVSRLKLSGWHSEIALHDAVKDGEDSMVAMLSAVANDLSIIRLDRAGQLSFLKSFKPDPMHFGVSNNPAFSSDGRIVYVAAADGNHIISIGVPSGSQLGLIRVDSNPGRITVAQDPLGRDLIAVTRTGSSPSSKSGGATILAADKGAFRVVAEFSPPEGVQFSRSNNIVFGAHASEAFIGSANGMLFAFSTLTGDLQFHKEVGISILGMTFNKETHSLVALCFSPKRDEIAVIGARRGNAAGTESVALKPGPQITRVARQSSLVRIMIELTSIGESPIVEFVTGGNVVYRHAPSAVKGNRLFINVPTSKIESLGKFDLRVTMADNTSSNSTPVEALSLISESYLHLTGKRSIQERPVTPATILTSVRAESEAGRLRVFVHTDGAATYKDFTLSDPSRVVIDLLGVRNKFGNKTISLESELASRVRVGEPKSGVVRVVIDSKSAVSYRVSQEGPSLIVTVNDNSKSASNIVGRAQQKPNEP
jgi:hypothetical protein